MEETENEKEDSINPSEEETDENEPQDEEQETSDKPEKTSSELEETNKKLYARMKKAEESEKKAKDELAKQKTRSDGSTDVFDLARTVSALREYTPDELGDIQMIAKAKGISPEDAVKTEEAQLIITARRLKVEKEKSTLEPSTKQDSKSKTKSLSEMNDAEAAEYLTKKNWVDPKWSKRSESDIRKLDSSQFMK